MIHHRDDPANTGKQESSLDNEILGMHWITYVAKEIKETVLNYYENYLKCNQALKRSKWY